MTGNFGAIPKHYTLPNFTINIANWINLP